MDSNWESVWPQLDTPTLDFLDEDQAFEAMTHLEKLVDFGYKKYNIADSPDGRDSPGHESTSSESQINDTGMSSAWETLDLSELLQMENQDGDVNMVEEVGVAPDIQGLQNSVSLSVMAVKDEPNSDCDWATSSTSGGIDEGRGRTKRPSGSRSAVSSTSPVVASTSGETSRKRKSSGVDQVNLVCIPKTEVSSKIVEDLENQIEQEQNKSKKNALIAKVNREKKKLKVNTLEGIVTKLSTDNEELLTRNEELEHKQVLLEEEVKYLKSVLAHASPLANLLQSIPNVGGVCLTTSFNADHNYGTPSAKKVRSEEAPVSGGVCLHVHQDHQVSLEFCAKCAKMASGAGRDPSL